MLNPSMTDLLEKVDNRYLLVNVAAKRAREIAEVAEMNDGKACYAGSGRHRFRSRGQSDQSGSQRYPRCYSGRIIVHERADDGGPCRSGSGGLFY